jgi:hypothetical protein
MAGGLATTLADIMMPALRRAGITTLPGTIPSADQFNELIPETNRMMDAFSLDGHKIYKTNIARYAMSPQQTTYFIGPTGDFVAPRPILIYRANVVLVGTSPEVHEQLRILSPAEWAAHTLTELPASWPWEIYDDYAYPDSQLYLYGYPTENNDLELFTWDQLQTGFQATTDAVVMPPGYEDFMVAQLALRATNLYPLDCKLSAIQFANLRRDANLAMENVQVLNTQCVPLLSEAAMIGETGSEQSLRAWFYGWGSGIS